MVTLRERGVFTPFETLVESLGSAEGRRLEARRVQLEAEKMKAAEREAAANRNAQIHQQAIMAAEARRARESQERLVRQQMAQEQAQAQAGRNVAGTVQYGRGLTGGATGGTTLGPRAVSPISPNEQIQSGLSQRALEMIQRGDLEGLRGFKFKPEGVEYTPFSEEPAKLPTSIQEAQYISEITGEPLDQVVRATSGLQQKARPGEIPGFPGVKLETGMTYLTDPNTGQVITDASGTPVTQPLPGSKRAAEFEKAKKQEEGRTAYGIESVAPVIQSIGMSIARIDEGALDEYLGFLPEGTPRKVARGFMASIPGTGPADVEETIQKVKSLISLKSLQQIRLNSPTGGALGNVSDKEGQRLEAASGDLSSAKTPSEVKFNLMRAQNLMIDTVFGTEQVRAALPKPVQEEINRKIADMGWRKFDLSTEAKKLLPPSQAKVFIDREKREIDAVNADYFDDSGKLKYGTPTQSRGGLFPMDEFNRASADEEESMRQMMLSGAGTRSGSVVAGGNLPRLGPPLRPYYG